MKQLKFLALAALTLTLALTGCKKDKTKSFNPKNEEDFIGTVWDGSATLTTTETDTETGDPVEVPYAVLNIKVNFKAGKAWEADSKAAPPKGMDYSVYDSRLSGTFTFDAENKELKLTVQKVEASFTVPTPFTITATLSGNKITLPAIKALQLPETVFTKE
ncbi:MAG: hypothetical protein IKP46_05090 [Bacteroidales bacterium]|nr:hypothetical protein [Bacteroidales bacterium]